MKMRQICIAVLLSLLIAPVARAQSFDKLWKQVEQADKKSLPQTAIKLTTQIYQKAEAEKNSPQMLKAYTWRMKYRDALTPDSFYVSLRGLEQWAQTAEQPLDRAVLHSLIAGIYADYAAQSRWQLRQRTDLMDEAPAADIREWSGNQLVQQVILQTSEALKNQDLLIGASARSYTPFVELGAASEYYRHDMFHLLGSRGVQSLSDIMGISNDSLVKRNIETIYQSMIAAYKKPGFEEASVLVMLNYLDWRQQTDPTFVSYQAPKGLLGLTLDPYLAGLNELMATYPSQPVCAEVYLAKARYAMNNRQPASALQLCDEAIRLYPAYKRIHALKNLKQEILRPDLNINIVQTAYPDSDLPLRVRHKNLDGFTVLTYRVNLSAVPKLKEGVNADFYRKHCRKLSEEHLSVLRPDDYLSADTTFTLKAPGEGLYLIQIVPDEKAERNVENFLHVTRFKVLTRRLPGDQYEIVTLDSRSGQPLAEATVTLYDSDEKVIDTFTTDATGKKLLTWQKEYNQLKATKGADNAMALQRIYQGGYYYNSSDSSTDRVELLTDRSLYRPGQTVYVKGIAYVQQSDTAHVLPNRNYTLTLLDANRQEVATRELRTNEFGSFTTDFTLPAACLNGMFTLQTSQGATSFRVEEYKRPTFDITFDKQEGSYSLGDKVEVKGKVQAFSGVSLQDLSMQYTVTRYLRFGWRGMQQGNEPLASGTVTLNENGQFSIPVVLKGEKTLDDMLYYNFEVNASVTNVAGETQSSSFNITVGNRSLLLSTELTTEVCQDDSIQALFQATNLNGQPVTVEGTVLLYLVTKDTPAIRSAKLWQSDEKPAYTGTFTSNQNTRLDGWKSLPSGAYQLVLTAKDDQGREVTYQTRLVLFSTRDTRPVVETPLWYYESNTSFDAEHPAVFYFGTSKREAYVMMDLFSGNKLLESKVLNLTDSIVRFEYPYREAYGDGLTVTFCFVKESEMLQRNVQLRKRLPSKTLAMKWDVFRDKLRPGQQEEWKLTIRTPQATPALAEMLATMYDASLDKIWKRNQLLSVYYDLSLPSANWMGGYASTNAYNYYFSSRNLPVSPLVYDRFVLAPSFVSDRDEVVVVGYGVQRKMSMVGSVARSAEEGVLAKGNFFIRGTGMDSAAPNAAAAVVENSSAEEVLEPMAELRTNFAETAFFYPQLRTNEQGEVSFSFTMPQSLTRWNFRGYAHTKGMLTGMLDAEATTSKEFMLTPNLPRFVRVGDQASVAASIANLTGKNLNGTASFTLFDPMTEKVISTQKQKFSVEAGKTVGVSFGFTVTDKYDVLGCRMIADGGTFSDGEQQLIPVLSNKENLTEAVAMPIRGNETRTFSLDSLFNRHSRSATDRRLTVEFTGNPAWYAVQALPALGQPTDDNAISWASMYYANTLASYIMNSQPRIRAVFDSWKQQGGTKETFLSNLQKNQEVKAILLSESPWVMEAKSEQQQQERIATLFDLNNIRNNNLTALTKLKELQRTDGSWAWYKGMNGSLSITDFIVETNARLAMLTGQPLEGQAQTLQQSAFAYLHQAALDEYKQLRAAEKAGRKSTGISNASVQYLYLLAISGEKVPDANEAAYRYLLAKLETMLPSMTIDNKALTAIILQKAGQSQKAQEFMASLKEHLVQTPEQGMYFAFLENPYNWEGMQIPVHVHVMEAFETVSKDEAVVEEMKLWLLKQKQTQQWSSPVSTVDAVYALLNQGASLLDSRGDVRISIGGQVLETLASGKESASAKTVTASAEAITPGLGYIKETFTEKKVVDARQITVQKRDAGIAWGAVYGQYLEEIDQVKQQGGELNVEKRLYVERLVNNVRQLQPVTAQTELAVGDKVVSRLSIRLDRSMEFIQLKDQRAACFEPIGNLSGYCWNNGFGYYVDVKDASTHFFFDGLGKGLFVLEYSYRVGRAGSYESGLATIQSAYAPEFVSHSASMKVTVK